MFVLGSSRTSIILAAAETLNVASYVVVREPFRRASRRIGARHVAWLSSRARSRHVPMKAPQKPIANHPYGDRNAKKLQRVVDIGCA